MLCYFNTNPVVCISTIWFVAILPNTIVSSSKSCTTQVLKTRRTGYTFRAMTATGLSSYTNAITYFDVLDFGANTSTDTSNFMANCSNSELEYSCQLAMLVSKCLELTAYWVLWGTPIGIHGVNITYTYSRSSSAALLCIHYRNLLPQIPQSVTCMSTL